MDFLKLILKLLLYKSKLVLFNKFLYFFFHTTIFLYRNIVHIFKGTSQISPQIKNSYFAERRNLNIDNKLTTNTNRTTFRQNLLSLEEIEKVNSKYFIVKDLLKQSQILNSDFFIKKSEFKKDFSSKSFRSSNRLSLALYFTEKIKTVYNSGGIFFRFFQLLKDIFTDLTFYFYRLKIFLKYLNRRQYFKKKSPYGPTKFYIFYHHVNLEYCALKMLIEKEYLEVLYSLEEFYFFKILFKLIDMFKLVLMYLYLVAKLLSINATNFFPYKKILYFFIMDKKLLFMYFFFKPRQQVIILFFKTKSFLRDVHSKLRVFTLKNKFLAKNLFFKSKVKFFIKNRAKANVEIIAIFLTIFKDLRKRFSMFSTIQAKIKFRTRELLKNKQSLLTRNLAFIESMLMNSRLRYKHLDKFEFNKAASIRRSLSDESCFSIDEDEFLHLLRKIDFNKIKSKARKVRLLNSKKLKLLKIYEMFLSQKKLNLKAVNFSKINHDIKTIRYKSKKFFIEKTVKVNFYSFFNKSDAVLNFYKKYGALKKFKPNLLEKRKTYLNLLFFLKYFIIKRERIWNTTGYSLTGAQPIFKKYKEMFEENFVVWYRFVKKFNSTEPFNNNTGAESQKFRELTNFTIAAKIFEIQKFFYKSLLKKVFFFFFTGFLFFCLYFFPYFCNLNAFASIFFAAFVSLVLTVCYFFFILFIYKYKYDLFRKNITSFYFSPKKYNYITIFFASFFSLFSTVLLPFKKFYIFDLISYFKIKKFMFSFSDQNKFNLSFEFLVQTILITLFLMFYTLCFYVVIHFFTNSNLLMLISLFLLCYLLAFIRLFILMININNSNSLWWKYLILNDNNFYFIYFYVERVLKFFFKHFSQNLSDDLAEIFFPVGKLNLSQKDINFVRDFLKLELNLETKSLTKLMSINKSKKI
jgi:hypothetical protein